MSEAWRARYGTEPPAELPDVESFLTHQSVRKFSDREVPESTIAALIAAAQSASTSSSLQLWSVISVQEPARRARIHELCENQAQVQNAPWFLAFFADHHRLRYAAQQVGESAEGLGYMEFLLMAAIDVALAAERLACAAEALGLGVCYIGALRNDPAGVKDFFELPDGVFGTFGMCIGYPHEDLTTEVKPRLGQDAVWFREVYNATPDIAEYDARMAEFYQRQNMRPPHSWSARSGRRVDRNHLTGREILKTWLAQSGLGVE